MIAIGHLLCPVDFSEVSSIALDHAIAMARWYKAPLEIIHVFSGALPPAVAYPPYVPPVAFGPEVRQELVRELERLAERARGAGVNAQANVIDGRPVPEIVERARASRTGLIVMGTHGAGGFERWVLGSTTEKVLRKAPCPVLTVPPHARGAEEVRFQAILCPIDFSPSSLKALEHSLLLAQETGSRLLLVHVTEFVREDLIHEETTVDLQRVRRNLARDAEERLRHAIPDQARTWCDPQVLVVAGKPYGEILRIAGEQDADLIVLGVQGRGTLDLMLFGSTTHQVVRAASCPVMTIRSG